MADHTTNEDNFDEATWLFDQQYEVLDKSLLGQGTYGKVYLARNTRTGELVAVKRMNVDSQEEGVPGTVIREISLLKELSNAPECHPNVVRLLDVFLEPSKLVLVFEYVEIDLKKYMERNPQLSPAAVKNLAYQLFRGVEFCHMNLIIHRDLKPANLLIDKHMHLKVADFGLARTYSVSVPKYTPEVVTLWYRPPEILLGVELYSVPVDLWSIGCVLAEMATGAPLFAGDCEIDTIFKIFQTLGTPTEAVWQGIVKFPHFSPSFPKWPPRSWSSIQNIQARIGEQGADCLDRLTCYNPVRRISARPSLSHPYFRDVDMSNIERYDGDVF